MAADKWLKPVSLQTAILQFAIIGRISSILKSFKGVQYSFKSELIISLRIFISPGLLPVTIKKRLSYFSIIFLINFKNIYAGTLLVSPDPPVPRTILLILLLIKYLIFVFSTWFWSIWIFGVLFTFCPNVLKINSFAASIIFWFFFF